MKKNETLCSLPELRLDVPIILRKADNIPGATTYPSDIRGTGYTTSHEQLLIITHSRGYLLVEKEDIGKLREELQWLEEEMDRRSRD